MKTIVVANRKGGAGKTTLAAHLSILFQTGGARVWLVDTDPQGSLASWWRKRSCETPEMLECSAVDLTRVVQRARIEGVAYCIVDTPPHAENSILASMRVADLVIVPTRPGPLDLTAVGATLEFSRVCGKSPLVVLNHTPPSAGWGESARVVEAREAVHAMGATVAEASITHRLSLSDALQDGLTVAEFEPTGKAAREVSALWREVNKTMENLTDGEVPLGPIPAADVDKIGRRSARRV